MEKSNLPEEADSTPKTFFDARGEFPSSVSDSHPEEFNTVHPLRRRRRRSETSVNDSLFSGIVASDRRIGVDSQDSSSLLLLIVGFLIKIVIFQIDLLLACVNFPFRILHFIFSVLTDPFRFLKNVRDHGVEWGFSVFKDRFFPFLVEWVEGQKPLGKLVVRIAWACFWSAYVLFVLIGCFLSAFLLGRLVMQFIVEEPVEVKGDLVFDFTQDSPVAMVPVTSCEGFECGVGFQDGNIENCRRIPIGRKLQLTVFFMLPESDYNQKLGIFQVRAEFVTVNGEVSGSSSYPCMLKFKSSVIRYLETALRSGSLLAGYSSESQYVKLEMKSFTEKADPTLCVRVFINRRAEYKPGSGIPQLYAASIKLESELPLFKNIIWKWRKTLFIWIGMSFFIFELLIVLLCCRPLVIPRVL